MNPTPLETSLILLVEDVHVTMTRRFPYSWSQAKSDDVYRHFAALAQLAAGAIR